MTEPTVELPEDVLAELARLKRDPVRFASFARQYGMEDARRMLQICAEEQADFQKYYPKLVDFVAKRRQAIPIPDEANFTLLDKAVRRIVASKLEGFGEHLGTFPFRAMIITSPLVAIALVEAASNAKFANPVVLTPEDQMAWNEIYDDPDLTYSWYAYQSFDVELNPTVDSFWLRNSSHKKMLTDLPDDVTPMVVSCGGATGSLSGSWSAELWSIDDGGQETLIGSLGMLIS